MHEKLPRARDLPVQCSSPFFGQGKVCGTPLSLPQQADKCIVYEQTAPRGRREEAKHPHRQHKKLQFAGRKLG